MKRRDLPKHVHPKHGRFYYVRADGPKRVWEPLTLIADGMPALFRALAARETERVADDRMPSVIADWQRDVMPRHAEHTQKDDIARCTVIAAAFGDFRAGEVRTPDVAEFLTHWKDKPRTYNAYRSLVRELMRYSIERGYRSDNPVEHLRTMSTPPSTRYLTDSEVRRIKAAAMRGDDGRVTRSGRTLCALIDVLYLTGQRPSDVLDLRWEPNDDDQDAPHVTRDGLRFRPSKTRKKTGAGVLVAWSPRLQDAIARLAAIRDERMESKRASQRVVCAHVFTTVDGQPLTYWGASSQWRRAVKRAKVRGAELRQMRAKALTDKAAREGIEAARTMGAHSTQGQTADYVRHRTPQKTGATR